MFLATPKWSWLSAKHHPSTSSTSRSHWSCHCDESKSKPNEFNGRCLSRGSNSWIMFTSWIRLGGKFGRGFQFAAQTMSIEGNFRFHIHQKAIDERPFPPSSHPKKVVNSKGILSKMAWIQVNQTKGKGMNSGQIFINKLPRNHCSQSVSLAFHQVACLHWPCLNAGPMQVLATQDCMEQIVTRWRRWHDFQKMIRFELRTSTLRIHVWYIYLHLP